MKKIQFKDFLSNNLDVSAWTPTDMLGVDPPIICHWLSINPEVKPVKQKPRKMSVKRCQALREEVDWLLRADSIRKTHYPEWHANPILVKKKSVKWRICIDITNLNQACPKDNFSLPMIDQLVDATTGHELLAPWTPTLSTTKSRCILKTKTRRNSSLTKGSTVIK